MSFKYHLTKRKMILIFLALVLISLSLFAILTYIKKINDSKTPLASINTEAMFYVENSESGSVTCIGDGLINSTQEVSNSISEATKHVVSAPDYSAITGEDLTIAWYSIRYSEDEFKVYGMLRPTDSTSASTVFASVEEMKSGNVTSGTTVSTLGFYSANDGGGATYNIIQGGSSDGMFKIALNNGLVASLLVGNNEVYVDQLGAKGDGATDDAPVIQKALDSGYSVAFGSGKTYKLISAGLVINKDLVIKGNNATLLVDDSYSPTSSGFQKFVIRTGFKTLDNLTISNITFACKVTEPSRYIGANYLCIFQPHYVKNITLNNLDITVYQSANKITNFWMYHGCDSLVLEGCHFHNDTIDSEGGLIFIDSETDTYFNYYNDFKNVLVNNCQLTGHCSDEALAIWGPNNINLKMTSSTIKWTHALRSHYSRPINISCDQDTNATFNVNIENCDIIADSPNADSAVGVGSYKPTNLNIYFKNCNFTANVRDSLLHFQLLPSSPSSIKGFDFATDKYNINFDSCNINCSKTITGSNKFYNNVSNGGWALDCNFTNCNINCNYCFAFIERYNTSTYYYAPAINLRGCTVNVNNGIGFIYKSNLSAVADINIEDCNINAPELKTISAYRYSTSNGGGLTQSNLLDASTSISETKLNSKAIHN